MRRDYGTTARLSLVAGWQSLPRPPHQSSVPVLFHSPRVIARQLAANRSASATIRTWDWWVFAVGGIAFVLVLSHMWGR